jgi:hypothetical protein
MLNSIGNHPYRLPFCSSQPFANRHDAGEPVVVAESRTPQAQAKEDYSDQTFNSNALVIRVVLVVQFQWARKRLN